jgi:hypothetical protein
MNASPEETRLRLLNGGYIPTPCAGKAAVLTAWTTRLDPTLHEIALWSRMHPAAQNTGILTRTAPTFDIDILNPEAAAAVEELVRECFEERGYVLTRFGLAPKRCIPFRTDTPFPKIAVVFDNGEKLEFLADGQQFIAYGTHPDTHKDYLWHGGEPGEVKREHLPYIHPEEAQALIDDAAQLLVTRFGYRPAKSHSNGDKRDNGAGDERAHTKGETAYARAALDSRGNPGRGRSVRRKKRPPQPGRL